MDSRNCQTSTASPAEPGGLFRWASAEQLTQPDRWKLILSAAFRNFLGGKVIGSPGRLADAVG